MPNRTVNLYTKEVGGTVIPGVLLRVLLASNGSFVTEGTTDVNGKLGPFLLPDGTYHVAPYKSGTSYNLPHVLTITQDDDFDIIGVINTLPTAIDPNRCRISGTLRDPSGQPLRNHSIEFWLQQDQVVVGGDIHAQRKRVTSNDSGYVDFEMLRIFTYCVRTGIAFFDVNYPVAEDALEGQPFTLKRFEVPDQSSLSIGDFLMPYTVRTFYNQASVSLAAGATDNTTEVSVLLSNGVTKTDGQLDYLTYDTADNAVATVSVTADGKMQVSGIAAGTTTLTVVRKSVPPTIKPDVALVVDTFTITVT